MILLVIFGRKTRHRETRGQNLFLGGESGESNAESGDGWVGEKQTA